MTQPEIKTLIHNSIQTPDGTILVSTHRHDYKEYTDTISGEVYMTDGGNAYARRTINKVPYIDLSVYAEDPIEKVREVFTWGTYDKNGDQELRSVLLKDMSNAHLEAIVRDGYKVSGNVIERELEYRADNNIFVEDL